MAIPRGDLSASKVSQYLECPRRYFESRAKGNPRPRATRPMRVGGLNHHALRLAAEARGVNGGLERVPRGQAPTVDEFRAYLAPSAAAQGGASDASMLSTSLEVLARLAPKLDFTRAVAAERGFSWAFDRHGRTVVGAFDLVEREDDGGYCAPDYKTGMDLPSYAEQEQHPQNVFYLAALRAEYPKAAGWRTSFWWVERQDRPYRYEWTPDVDAVARALASDVLARIERGEAAPTEGAHCVGCDYRDGCPGYARLLRPDSGTLKATPDAADDVLLAQRQVLRAREKAAAERREEHDELIRARVRERGTLVGGGHRARLTPVPTRVLPGLRSTAARLSELLGRDLAEVQAEIADVDQGRVRALLAKLAPDERAAAEALLDEIRVVATGHDRLDVREVSTPWG